MASQNIALVRDAFERSKWYGWFPVDVTNGKWVRVDFWWPKGSLTYNTYAVIESMHYGTVCPGRWVTPQGGDVNYADVGTWNNQGTGANTWNGRSTTVFGTGTYAEITIPNDHDLIKIIYVDRTTYDNFSLYWDDGTAISTVTMTAGATDNVMEVVITGAAAAGRKLRIRKVTNDTSILIINGVRSWNSSGIGDPRTEKSTGVALGHDIIDSIPAGGGNIASIRRADEANGDAKSFSHSTSHEFAIQSGPDGGALKWTGGSEHFGSGQANYTYHVGSYPSGPLVSVDGITSNSLWDNTNNPTRTILLGTQINITSEGFSDWSEDGVEDAGEPDMTWCYNLYHSNLSITVAMLFNAATDLSVSFYVSMLKIPSGLQNGTLSAVDESPILSFDSGDIEITGSNSGVLKFDALSDFQVTINTLGPAKRILWSTSQKKFYCHQELNGFPYDISSTNIKAGQIFSFGSSYEFKKPPVIDVNVITVLGSAPLTSDDVASKILDTPANLLRTDINGRVDIGLISGNTTAMSNLEKSAGSMIQGTIDNSIFTPTAAQFEANDITDTAADHYNGRIILFTSGSLIRQAAQIIDYELSGANGKFTVSGLTAAPANNDTFIIV